VKPDKSRQIFANATTDASD